jgi:hypothetical protein
MTRKCHRLRGLQRRGRDLDSEDRATQADAPRRDELKTTQRLPRKRWCLNQPNPTQSPAIFTAIPGQVLGSR